MRAPEPNPPRGLPILPHIVPFSVPAREDRQRSVVLWALFSPGIRKALRAASVSEATWIGATASNCRGFMAPPSRTGGMGISRTLTSAWVTGEHGVTRDVRIGNQNVDCK